MARIAVHPAKAIDVVEVGSVDVRTVLACVLHDGSWPDLAGLQVECAARGQGIALEYLAQHLQIHGERPQQRRRATPRQSVELIGQLCVADPASFPQGCGSIDGELPRPVDLLCERDRHNIARELPRW